MSKKRGAKYEDSNVIIIGQFSHVIIMTICGTDISFICDSKGTYILQIIIYDL